MKRDVILGTMLFLLQLAVALTWSQTIDLRVVGTVGLVLGIDCFIRDFRLQRTSATSPDHRPHGS